MHGFSLVYFRLGQKITQHIHHGKNKKSHEHAKSGHYSLCCYDLVLLEHGCSLASTIPLHLNVAPYPFPNFISSANVHYLQPFTITFISSFILLIILESAFRYHKETIFTKTIESKDIYRKQGYDIL